eukprot:gene27524-37783_t
MPPKRSHAVRVAAAAAAGAPPLSGDDDDRLQPGDKAGAGPRAAPLSLMVGTITVLSKAGEERRKEKPRGVEWLRPGQR